MRIIQFLFIITLVWPTVLAQDLSTAQQDRAQALYREVRCPVCNGQSISESDVPIAIALREFVDKEITAGVSDEDIKSSLAERFGDDILFNPPLARQTLPLWILPWLFLALLCLISWLYWAPNRREKDA